MMTEAKGREWTDAPGVYKSEFSNISLNLTRVSTQDILHFARVCSSFSYETRVSSI